MFCLGGCRLAASTLIAAMLGAAVTPITAQEACPAKFEARPTAIEDSAKEPPNLGRLKSDLKLYYRCSYRAAVRKVLSAARDFMERNASGSAANPAIVLDIDETSLSNWAEIWQNDFGYFAEGACEMKPKTPCGVHAWELMAVDPPIEPTLELFNVARAKNIAVFFITGRDEGPAPRAATEDNLRKAGYSGWTKLIMKGSLPECGKENTTAFKRCARKSIEDEHYTIVANVGDQWSDLDWDGNPPPKEEPGAPLTGSFSKAIFKVPNPFYIIP